MPQLESYLRTNLKTRQLHLLVALDEFRNLRQVADHSHVTQPAISKALSELEKGLGVTLFERTSQGMRPNAYGECLIRYARGVLKDLHHAHDELRSLIMGTSGKVSIGAMPGVISTLLPAALALMKEHSPAATVMISEGTLGSLMPDLWKGNLDMIVGRLPLTRGSHGLEEKIFFEEPVMLVTGKHHPLAKRKKLSWKDLEGFPWVLPPPGALLREPLERELQRHGLPMPVNYIETLSIHLTRAYLQITNSIACLAGHISTSLSRPNLVGILPLEMPTLIRPQGVTWNSQRTLSPSARLMFECLEKTAADIAMTLPGFVHEDVSL